MSKSVNHKWATSPAALAVLTAGLAAWAASRPAEIPFARHMIDPGAYETCAMGNINRDGHPDIVSGENWVRSGFSGNLGSVRSLEYRRGDALKRYAIVAGIEYDDGGTQSFCCREALEQRKKGTNLCANSRSSS
jgi:hypothetical protein